METSICSFEIDTQSEIKSLKILINQCWKTLPIYEGKNRDGQIAYSREEAYENFQKHLTFLITKISGASKLLHRNQYYIELAYMLSGMRDYTVDEHDNVKYIILHCTKLINGIIEDIDNGS